MTNARPSQRIPLGLGPTSGASTEDIRKRVRQRLWLVLGQRAELLRSINFDALPLHVDDGQYIVEFSHPGAGQLPLFQANGRPFDQRRVSSRQLWIDDANDLDHASRSGASMLAEVALILQTAADPRSELGELESRHGTSIEPMRRYLCAADEDFDVVTPVSDVKFTHQVVRKEYVGPEAEVKFKLITWPKARNEWSCQAVDRPASESLNLPLGAVVTIRVPDESPAGKVAAHLFESQAVAQVIASPVYSVATSKLLYLSVTLDELKGLGVDR